MTDEQLFWTGLAVATFGLVVALTVMFGPHVLWRLRNRPRRSIVDRPWWL